jgi:hypothetical protein
MCCTMCYLEVIEYEVAGEAASFRDTNDVSTAQLITTSTTLCTCIRKNTHTLPFEVNS